MTRNQPLPGYRGDLNRECVTLAEALRPEGCRTYMTGKWHVTASEYEYAIEGSRDNWPLQRGFDRFFGTLSGGGSFLDPATLTRDNELIPPGENFYYTDAIGENAATFIAEHDRDHPFFMYVSFTAPHWPLHAKPRKSPPFFPASGPATGSFNGLHAKSKFLAATENRTPAAWRIFWYYGPDKKQNTILAITPHP